MIGIGGELHGTVPMKVGAVLFIRGGRRISISRYGSCKTSRTSDSEGIERHLEAPIRLTGKKDKKEEPKTNNRLCLVFVLGSYWRREGFRTPICAKIQPPLKRLKRKSILFGQGRKRRGSSSLSFVKNKNTTRTAWCFCFWRRV